MIKQANNNLMSALENAEQNWKKFCKYKDSAEQHMFITIAMFDFILTQLYKDLQTSKSEDKANIFNMYMHKKVFPALGIT